MFAPGYVGSTWVDLMGEQPRSRARAVRLVVHAYVRVLYFATFRPASAKPFRLGNVCDRFRGFRAFFLFSSASFRPILDWRDAWWGHICEHFGGKEEAEEAEEGLGRTKYVQGICPESTTLRLNTLCANRYQSRHSAAIIIVHCGLRLSYRYVP